MKRTYITRYALQQISPSQLNHGHALNANKATHIQNWNIHRQKSMNTQANMELLINVSNLWQKRKRTKKGSVTTHNAQVDYPLIYHMVNKIQWIKICMNLKQVSMK